jgi:hypothetical protein
LGHGTDEAEDMDEFNSDQDREAFVIRDKKLIQTKKIESRVWSANLSQKSFTTGKKGNRKGAIHP